MYKTEYIRVARALAVSSIIQGLSLEEMSAITKNLFGAAVHKNTIRNYQLCLTKTPRVSALGMLAPLIFRCTFTSSDNKQDRAGNPVFQEWGELQFKLTEESPIVGRVTIPGRLLYDADKHDQVKQAMKPSQLPDYALRFRDYEELNKAIIIPTVQEVSPQRGEIPVIKGE